MRIHKNIGPPQEKFIGKDEVDSGHNVCQMKHHVHIPGYGKTSLGSAQIYLMKVPIQINKRTAFDDQILQFSPPEVVRHGNVVASPNQPLYEIGANHARPAGNEYLHWERHLSFSIYGKNTPELVGITLILSPHLNHSCRFITV